MTGDLRTSRVPQVGPEEDGGEIVAGLIPEGDHALEPEAIMLAVGVSLVVWLTLVTLIGWLA